MCYNKIYKFTDNVVCMPTYFKTIDDINSIIIIGNTAGLCGEFINKSNDDYDGFYPETNTDGGSEEAALNLDFIEKLIDKHAEIVIVCNNTITNYYWNIVFTYFAICLNKNISKCCIADNINKNEDYENIMKNIIKKKHKFDVGFINAPYDGTLHEKFESMMFDLCNDEIVWVGPTTWLLGKKQSKLLTEPIDKYHTEITSINGVDYFDGSKFGQMGITHIDLHKDDTLTIFDGKAYEKCADITTYSNDTLIMQFKNIIEPLYTKDNLDNYLKLTNKILPSDGSNRLLELNPNMNWWCLHISRFAGSGNQGNTGESFYTILSKNKQLTFNKQGYYKDIFKLDINDKTKNSIYFAFNDKTICNNFINYCYSYFLRISLYLNKTNLSLCKGEMKTIPWFDFSDSMFNGSPEDIDIALFCKYNISQEIVDHILQILPNYYDLDLSKYKNLYA